MRNCLHKAANNPRSLRIRSLIERDTISIRIFVNDEEAIKNISTRRSNSLRCYCKTALFGEIRLSEFKRVKWLQFIKQNGYDGADIDENEGKYSVWRYE